jgi:hypothetical protein
MSRTHRPWALFLFSFGLAASVTAGTMNLAVSRVVVVDNC